MNILTPAQLTAYKRKGWKVFQPGFDISYKSHRNTPWFVIREFFRNALDEHDQAGVSAIPSLLLSAKDAVIEDQGRGLGAESLLLRESKGEMDLRGHFGEGMKFACITAVRLGYTPVIESPSVTISAHASPVTMGRAEATLLTFLYREQEQARKGTKVTIEGYKGELYRDRFTTFLDKPIFTLVGKSGRFERKHSIYAEPKGRLYVGDSYMLDREKSAYSYNLWGLDLNPDRISEVNNEDLGKKVAGLWIQVGSKEHAALILKAQTTPDSFESNLRWDWMPSDEKIPYWQAAWRDAYGSRAVFYTSETLAKLAESYGYKPVGKMWSFRVRQLWRYLAPTDESITSTRIKELTAPRVLSDTSLSPSAQLNLRLVRYLANACESCRYEGKRPSILAAVIAPDPRIDAQILGLCSSGEGHIYLVPAVLETEEAALSVFYHEMGHWAGGPDAADGTMAHTRAVQTVASAVSIVIQRQYAVVADILGATVSPAPPPVGQKLSKLDIWKKYQSLS